MDSQAADAASAAQQLKFSKVTTIFSQQNSELEHLFSEVLGPLNFLSWQMFVNSLSYLLRFLRQIFLNKTFSTQTDESYHRSGPGSPG